MMRHALLLILSAVLCTASAWGQIATFDFDEAPLTPPGDPSTWDGFVQDFDAGLEFAGTTMFELSRDTAPTPPGVGVNGFAFFGNAGSDDPTTSPVFILDSFLETVPFYMESIDVSVPMGDMGAPDTALRFDGYLGDPMDPMNLVYSIDFAANDGILTPFTAFPADLIDNVQLIAQSPQNCFCVAIDNFIINLDPPTTGPPCDLDGNDICDGVDVNLVTAEIVDVKGGGMADLQFDLNGDMTVDNGDLDQWLIDAGAENVGVTGGNPYLAADANLDGGVDGQDFVIWNTNKFTTNSDFTAADFNADGTVNGQDFVIWNGLKFMTSDGGASAVPEPTAAISLAGLLSLAMLRRRR